MMNITDEDECLRPADSVYNERLIYSLDYEMNCLVNLLEKNIITKKEFNNTLKQIQLQYNYGEKDDFIFDEDIESDSKINMDYLYEKNIIENEIHLEKLFNEIKRSVELKRQFYNTEAKVLMSYLNRMKNIDNICSDILEIIQNIIIYDNVKIETHEKRNRIIENIYYILNHTTVSRKLSDEIKKHIIEDFEKHLQI